jgi:hypothetical protein
VDRLYGKKTIEDVWKIGEEYDIDRSDGLGWLDMAAGTLFGFPLGNHYNGKQ